MRTKVSNGLVIGFKDGGHHVLRDGVVVYEDDRIVHVGGDYNGDVDDTIDASGKLVIPGFVSTHAHVNAHEGSRLITDLGRRDVMRSGFLNYTPNNGIDGRPVVAAASPEHSIRFGFAQMIRNGVTTVLSFGAGSRDDPKLMTDLAAESGLRVYYAPQATGAENYFDASGRLQPLWNEKVGFEQLDRAVRYIEDNHGKFDGRLRGLILVRNFILATVPLMKRAKEYADQLGVQFSTHFCEQLFEFHETVRDTRVTPVDIMDDAGLLGPNVILAHCVYIAGHTSTTWEYSNDLEKLGRTKTVVSHCPVAYMRRGYNLEGFERYLEHGVTMAMGTDVMPHDMLAEMRIGSLAAKLISKNHEAGTSKSLFDAATLGGATAFGRDDIGRLAPGAKADIVILDFDNMQIGPIYDPIRSLVHLATPDLIETVICDGKVLMTNGELVGYDERTVAEGAKLSLQQVIAQFPQRHWSGKSIAECFPLSYPEW